jgi:GT2 family glycosyltransferase
MDLQGSLSGHGASLKTYIVIVNWNGWKDTIECLESVFRLRHSDFAVIVCDNGSRGDSLRGVMEWARGERMATPASAEMGSYTSPPVPKPIVFSLLEGSSVNEPELSTGNRLVLIRSERNLGFAGGNNLGLRCILRRNDHGYVWLLNNDTVVHPDALTKLIGRVEEDPRIGICGSRLCFYSAPHFIQACGGSTYSPRTGRNRHIGEFKPVSEAEDRAAVERQIGYVVGASLFVSRRFLSSIGLMSEDYFLYGEELDWATRAKGKFLQGYAPGSIVFHKQGNSMGGKSLTRQSEPEESFLVSDFYSVRNQLRFTRRYYPQYLPFVGGTVAWRLLKRIAAGKWKRVRSVVRGVLSAFSEDPPPYPVSNGRGSLDLYASD